eukprot:3814487-Pleurochrysis_carterae.AAC.2
MIKLRSYDILQEVSRRQGAIIFKVWRKASPPFALPSRLPPALLHFLLSSLLFRPPSLLPCPSASSAPPSLLPTFPHSLSLASFPRLLPLSLTIHPQHNFLTPYPLHSLTTFKPQFLAISLTQ